MLPLNQVAQRVWKGVLWCDTRFSSLVPRIFARIKKNANTLLEDAREMPENLSRQDIVLAAMASSPSGFFSPVQIQKLIFVLDRHLPPELFEQKFNFIPYSYGPFDANVYRTLESLSSENKVVIMSFPGSPRRYSITALGEECGNKILQSLHENVSAYIKAVANWIKSLSFSALLSAIYKEYPEMAKNSVFKQ